MNSPKRFQDRTVFKISKYLHYNLRDFQREIFGVEGPALIEAKFLVGYATCNTITHVVRCSIGYKTWSGLYVTEEVTKYKYWLNWEDYGKTWVVLRD